MYKLNKKISILNVINKITGKFHIINNCYEYEFDNIAPVNAANKNSIVFIANEIVNKSQTLKETKASIIVMKIDKTLNPKDYSEKLIIDTDSPRTIISRIASLLARAKNADALIKETAQISSEAKIGKNTIVGHGSVIGHAKIGDRCKIMRNVIIEDNCIIGDDVYIGDYALIGSNAFSLITNEPQANGDSFPQLGGVIIKNGVEIGAYSGVQRGTFGNTLIDKNVKIDTYVQIAHNVQIGSSSIIIGHSKISGGVVVGENVYIGQSVSIGNIKSIGSNSFIGMGSVVIREVSDNVKMFGNPAKEVYSPDLKAK